LEHFKRALACDGLCFIDREDPGVATILDRKLSVEQGGWLGGL